MVEKKIVSQVDSLFVFCKKKKEKNRNQNTSLLFVFHVTSRALSSAT